MKKSIVMALIVLAIIAGPVFAGEFGHRIVLDAGFGVDFNSTTQSYAALTDGATNWGASGTLDDNNSIYIGIDLGGKDLDAAWSNDIFGAIDDFSATTNVLGAFGVADSPVSLTLNYGYGRMNLHNRFNQYTGWEWTGRKDIGAAAQWDRAFKMSLTANIMGYVNVMLGWHPEFDIDNNSIYDTSIIADVWTSIPAGPVNLDISAFMINDKDNNLLSLGGEVKAGMGFGPVNLMIAANEIYKYTTSTGGTGTNVLMFAVKADIAAGPVGIGVGAWMDITTTTTSTLSMAADVSVSIAMVTIFGGMRFTDLSNAANSYIYDFGAKLGLGATSVAVGLNGGTGAHGGATGDMNAVDGTTGLDGSGPVLYVKLSTQMW